MGFDFAKMFIEEAIVDSNSSSSPIINETSGTMWDKSKKITITAPISAGTAIDINNSGLNHIVSGDSIDLGIDESAFNNNIGLYITLNGIDQLKGSDVVYTSNSAFESAYDLEVGNTIIINANSNENSTAWTKEKKVTITDNIPAGTEINVNASGVNYTVEGGSIDFGTNESAFNNNIGIYITLNGVDQEKGSDIIYNSGTSVESIYDLHIGDVIIIMF